MKILQLCHKMPFPLHDGGACSISNTALGLINQGMVLKVHAINTPKCNVDLGCMPLVFKEKCSFEFSWVDTRIDPARALINLFTDRSYLVERFFSLKFNADLIRILTRQTFDIIQLEHVYLCLYLDSIRKHSHAKVILRPQNVENEVWKSVMKFKINPLKKFYLKIATTRLMKFESEMATKVNGILAISGSDADTFHSYAPEVPLLTVPIGFDISQFTPHVHFDQFNRLPVFYHLGSMDWLPNVQGIKWFIKEVIPLIKADYPDFIFRIAGKKIPRWFYRLTGSNVMVDGEVADSMQYQEYKDILVVPLFSGGGLRVKIIEAMALGKTVISTTKGAEGIPYTDQENILIADTKEDFIIQIKKCMNSMVLCKEIGKKAKLLATENYNCRETGKKMVEFYESIIQKS